MTRTAAVWAPALMLLALGGFFFFPGHTFLQSDSQIYLPILDRFSDPSLYAKDPVALRPHVSYTVYDEMALALRRITGLEFKDVLVFQQILTRFCGLAGMFLIGRALAFPPLAALLLASIYGLGATISGPAVLILEYEPVPRAFAGPLLVLAIGLAANGRWTGAGIALGVALLYHPPTLAPLLAVLLVLTVWRRERWRTWAGVGAAASVLLVMSRFQGGVVEQQNFWGRIDSELEALQRLRGSYNWVTLWGAQWIRHYEFLFLMSLLVHWRWRRFAPPFLRHVFLGLAIYGIAMIPVSYILLERAKWTFMPQFQPARAVLFLALGALVGAAACGIQAARERRWLEAPAWFLLAYAIPQQADVMGVILPDLREEIPQRRFGIALLMAALASAAIAWSERKRTLAGLLTLAAAVAPFYLMPAVGKVSNYPALDHPEIHELSDWARGATAKDAVFLFPDAGQDLTPGLFRVWGKRSVYVDWKAGGQVNLLRGLGLEWWQRWKDAMEGGFDPANLDRYRRLEINYLVTKESSPMAGLAPVYRNAKYWVYRLR